MKSKRNDIDIIHSCEEHFNNWLKLRLSKCGISVDQTASLSYILDHHESELDALKQHIKPLKKWDRIKKECYDLNEKLNGSAEQNEDLGALIQKAAFEGQVLWLTINEE